MGFLSKIVGVRDVVGVATDAAKDVASIVDEFIETPDEKRRAQLQPLIAQQIQNRIEAASGNWFNSGWRPFIGWVCGVSLGLYYIPQFFLASLLWLKMSWDAGALVAYPASPDSLLELVFALLGMAALRTYEKDKGVAK